MRNRSSDAQKQIKVGTHGVRLFYLLRIENGVETVWISERDFALLLARNPKLRLRQT